MEKKEVILINNYCDLITEKNQIQEVLSEIECKGSLINQIDLLLRGNECKIESMYKTISELGNRGINTHFSNHYKVNDSVDQGRKSRELSNGIRPVPVGELDTQNNIYLNIKEIGYLSSFLTLLHLYGHRIQGHIMDTSPDSEQGKQYHAITKYVGREKPLNMNDVYNDYHKNIGRESDYEQDFLEFEKEAFSFGIGLCEYLGINIDDNLQYLINVFVETDFDEIKQRRSTQPNKSGFAFNERYLYNYQHNRGKIGGKYQSIDGIKCNINFNNMQSTSGVTVIRE